MPPSERMLTDACQRNDIKPKKLRHDLKLK
jgi:hypothetical protein